MSRVELNTIQAKLKAAIQNHQMLVVKMKGDNQNVSLKKGLAELQEEIKRLSEEQKKIVMKLRESLVKSSTQTLPPPIVTVGQTITAIGQPRLVSFPTQGGSTILPVGMVAVPIAHMQRPAVGMAIHSAGGPLSQATNISLIPAGILSAGCNLTNNILHGNITINSFGNLGNTVSSLSSSKANVVSTHVQSQVSNGSSTPSCGGTSSHTTSSHTTSSHTTSSHTTSRTHYMATSSDSSKTSGIVLNNLTNMANLFIATSINNASLIANTPIATSINNASLIANTPIATSINNASLIANTPTATSINNASLKANTPIATSINNASLIANTPIATSINNASLIANMPIASSSCNGHVTSSPCLPATPGLIVTHFQQQPLVQPQLLHQQQQQILQLIQQQQQPQQRLASHLPIKVPQYTASFIRPVTAPAQYCNIAPAPTSQAVAAPGTTKVNKESADLREVMKVHQTHLVKPHHQTHTKLLSSQVEKEKFLEMLELYTVDALNEMLRRRNERKRRTTANPHYSFGFEMSRKERGATKKHRGRGLSLDSTEHNTGSKKMQDNHDDYCAVCNRGGQLLMCETCRFVYHLDCLNPPLTQAPKYAWSCPHCLVSGKGLAHLNSSALAKVHSYISHRTAQVDAMKTEHVKSKELSEELKMLGTQMQDLSSKLTEETETKTRLTAEENIVQQELTTLSEFIHSMKTTGTGHFV